MIIWYKINASFHLVVMELILMIISFHSVLTLLEETWCWSLSGPKGWNLTDSIILRDVKEHKKLSWTRFIYCFFTARRTLLVESSDEILKWIKFSLQSGCIYTDLNNKVNRFLARLRSIHMQKVGVKARPLYTARFLLKTIVRD